MFLNQLKTVILLAFLSGLLMLLGGLFGGSNGVVIAFVISLALNAFTYFFSETLVLKLYKAKPLDKEKYKWIYALVEDLSHTMGIPVPRLWLISTPMANAFATGRNPKHSSVAFTTGIIALLDKHELRGVIAHELSHVKNRDILVSTVAATLATALSYLASIARHSFLWSRNDRRKESGIGLFIAALLMPIAGSLIQLAISRSREYLADETGAHSCGDPLALASALEKLHNHIPQAHMNPDDTVHAATASLFIVHPFKTENLMALFSTHPPMKKRVERLRILSDIIYNREEIR